MLEVLITLINATDAIRQWFEWPASTGYTEHLKATVGAVAVWTHILNGDY